MALQKCEDLSQLPIDKSEVQAYLRLSDQSADPQRLESALKSAVAAVQGYTGRFLSLARWKMTLNAGFAFDQSDTQYLSGKHSRGDRGILLPRAPFARLEGDPVIMTAYGEQKLSHYRLDTSGRSAKVHIDPNAVEALERMDQIQITFDAGYDAETLPFDIRQAVVMIAGDLYDANLAANQQPIGASAFSEKVLLLLRPYQNLRLI